MKSLMGIRKISNRQLDYLKIKKVGDRFVAGVALVVLSPVYLCIYIIIKTSAPRSPVFFKQERVGRHQKSFIMYKFRTMHTDAEEQLSKLKEKNEIAGPMFKMTDDPRVTRIGKILRKTSLDELPQFWNVVIGDMSLVGPRPPLQREVAEYSEHHLKRLQIMPGCTGLWQVSGRNKLSFEEMVALDLDYISNVSLIMDTKIILKTIVIMVIPKGAY